MTTNNGGAGLVLDGDNSRFVRFISAGNDDDGVRVQGDGNVFMHNTMVQNGGSGLSLLSGLRTLLVNTVATHNLVGLEVADAVNELTVRDLVSVDNETGVQLDADGSTFEGKLLLKLSDGCVVASGLSAPGLETGCTLPVASAANVVSTSSLQGAFYGIVQADDPLNTSTTNANGSIAYGNIVEWDLFSEPARHWGRFDGGSARGRCKPPSDTCAIWDWSVTTGSVLADRFGDPAGAALTDSSHVIEHQWVTTMPLCASLHGAWNGGVCTSTFLDYAFEFNGGPDGDGLCGAADVCLLDRNYGSYPGEGDAGGATTVNVNGTTTVLTPANNGH